MALASVFANGAWIFLLVEIGLFFAFVWGFYTIAGSAINARPYSNPYGNAPGANGQSAGTGSRDQSADMRNWQRGTR